MGDQRNETHRNQNGGNWLGHRSYVDGNRFGPENLIIKVIRNPVQGRDARGRA